jgi:hypothetical protein
LPASLIKHRSELVTPLFLDWILDTLFFNDKCVFFGVFAIVAFLCPFGFDMFDIDEAFEKETEKVGWDCDRKLAHSSSTESILF